MNAENLLKSISELIKKNEQFFIDHPEIFKEVEVRLHKAIDYEDYQPEDYTDPEDYYNDSYDESGISDLFDNIPESDIDEDMDGEITDDEASDWLRENDPNFQEYLDEDDDGEYFEDEDNDGIMEGDEDSDGDIDLPEEVQHKIKETDEKTDKPKVSSSGYRDWSPKDKYEDKHQAAIDKHMANGWSHREAERMAGAHEAPTNFYDALKHKIKPSQPSEKMLAHMKGVAGEWLRNAERKIGESAEAKKNPIKHASAKALTAHEDVHSDFSRAYNQFLQSDDVKNLSGRERHKAVQAFKNKWNAENPDMREKSIAAAESGKTFGSAMEERKKHLEEGKQHIATAHMIGGDDSMGMGSAGEFSSAASGNVDDMTHQGAAQMAGGTQEEGGYTSATVRDPAAVFAERNPEYVKQLQTKLTSKLSPDQATRLKGIQGIKKGNE